MIADDEPHSCDLSYCGQPRLSTGVDPGRDAALGTPDDLEILPVMADVKQQGITPIFLFTGNPQPGKATVFAQWQCYTQAGGGEAWNAPNGSLPAGLVEDLRDLIVAKSLVCDVLEVRPQGGFESWVTSVVPDPALGVQLPARLTFDFDLGPPAGTAPGTYAFAIDFVCDGVVKASQDVTITVPGLCSDPVGTIGNRLFAVKQGPDVLLDWSLGPLNPRSYNVHREALKTLLAPPASAPIGQAAGAEAYTDANAVPPPPALTFYETYGRACSGSSLFD
jgi:hypothetical protein